MTPVDAIIARLFALHPKRIDLSLDRMWRLLDQLGHPEQRLPPTIHVAGTNGKGSTIAFLRAMLEQTGQRVHVYTSPHLVRFNERFRLGRPGGGALVSDQELADVLAECERANGGAPITVFELTTAAGLLLFSRHAADALLLEVGLGGRLDATNVIERPVATVVTPISLDHIEYLGNSLEKIAGEKSGILKHGVPTIVAPQMDESLRVITTKAAGLEAPLSVAGTQWAVCEQQGRLIYQDKAGLLDLPEPSLKGRHQFDNAATAIATLRSLKNLEIPAEAFGTGLTTVDWPARLQRLTRGRLVAVAPQGSEIWLDGAHNPAGAGAVAAALRDLERRMPRPIVLVVGMLATKDCEGFLDHFVGVACRVIAVPVHQDMGLPAETIVAAAERVGIAAQTTQDVAQALAAADLGLRQSPRIVLTGSLYLAGEILAANGTPPI